MHLIAKVIRISHANFHCNRLTTVRWVQQLWLMTRIREEEVVQLVEYRTRNQEVAGSTHTRSTASNLE